MGSSFKIGRAFGIDLKVHWTFFLLLAFFAFASYQRTGSLTTALITALVIVALFVCVVLHEYGHSLVAQSLGIEIQDITLLPIGGVARLKDLHQKTREEDKNHLGGLAVYDVRAPIFLRGVDLLGGKLQLQPHTKQWGEHGGQ